MNTEEAAALTGLIIDRTEQDVEYARSLLRKGTPNLTEEEKELLYSLTLKGVYNPFDIERVRYWIVELSEVLYAMGYPVILEDWPEMEWFAAPTASELNKFLLNVKIIRKAFATLPTTPAVPDTMRFFTYEQANAIERILCDVIALFSNMVEALNYSGEMYGGEM